MNDKSTAYYHTVSVRRAFAIFRHQRLRRQHLNDKFTRHTRHDHQRRTRPETTNQITVCKRIQSRQKLGPSKHAANARLSLFVVRSSQVDQLANQFPHENGNSSSNRIAYYEVVYKLLKKSKMLHKPRTEHCS